MTRQPQTPRTLPHNLDVEASILGGVLLRRECLDLPDVDRLTVEDFYSPKHQAVWMAMQNLKSQLAPIDPVTVEAELARLGKSDAVGGLAFMGELACRVPSPDNVARYARTASDLAIRRAAIVAAGEVVDRLFEADDDDEDLNGAAAVQYALRRFEAIDQRATSRARTIGDIVVERARQVYQLLGEREAGREVTTGIPTGIGDFDARIGGLPPGILVVIGARPSMGKSSLLLAIADNASAAGHGAHAFLLEDSTDRQADRALSRDSGVPASAIAALDLRRGEMEELGRSMRKLRDRKNWIVEDGADFDVDEVIRLVRSRKRENNTKVVIVDYLQLLRGSPSKRYRAEHRHIELSDICTAFSAAAKADGICYVVASQLNRALESRSNKRPTLADLRESGAIEERARMVIFPFRPSHYGPPVEGVDYGEGSGFELDGYAPTRPWDDAWTQRMELIVAKNSNGKTGWCPATWHGPTMRVS